MLQNMFDICVHVSHVHVSQDLALTFNCKKSHCIMIGPKRLCTLSNLMFNDKELQWVQELKYLGITLVSDSGFSIYRVCAT